MTLYDWVEVPASGNITLKINTKEYSISKFNVHKVGGVGEGIHDMGTIRSAKLLR